MQNDLTGEKGSKILGSLWGAVVGDALGVPVEFKRRESLRQNPVVSMREFGTYHQKKGTWSDDSSLLLCSLESLTNKGFDLADMARLFVEWYRGKVWTPWGTVFDIGGATQQSIIRLEQGIPAEEAGAEGDNSNGNGSLMRILPVGLYFSNLPVNQLLNYAERASCLTHRHLRSRMGCGFYCALVSELLNGNNPEGAYKFALEKVQPFYEKDPYLEELSHFSRVFSGKLGQLKEAEIQTQGYVIYTLEAALWCFLTSGSYSETVLKAVNLGFDTDTTAIVAGGLAGLYYGLSNIPEEWLEVIARRSDIQRAFEAFIKCPVFN